MATLSNGDLKFILNDDNTVNAKINGLDEAMLHSDSLSDKGIDTIMAAKGLVYPGSPEITVPIDNIEPDNLKSFNIYNCLAFSGLLSQYYRHEIDFPETVTIPNNYQEFLKLHDGQKIWQRCPKSHIEAFDIEGISKTKHDELLHRTKTLAHNLINFLERETVPINQRFSNPNHPVHHPLSPPPAPHPSPTNAEDGSSSSNSFSQNQINTIRIPPRTNFNDMRHNKENIPNYDSDYETDSARPPFNRRTAVGTARRGNHRGTRFMNRGGGNRRNFETIGSHHIV